MAGVAGRKLLRLAARDFNPRPFYYLLAGRLALFCPLASRTVPDGGQVGVVLRGHFAESHLVMRHLINARSHACAACTALDLHQG